jgi:putative transposase
MPRHARVAPAGAVLHCLNRGNGRSDLFEKPEDFAAFERLLLEAMRRFPVRLLAYCLMHNHWHLVLWPEHDGEVTAFLRWLTMTHSQRLHAHRHTTGSGHVYQGRFKSFPVQPDDEHLLAVIRYVERNALRAGLVERAQDWRWCSLWRRLNGDEGTVLSDWPIDVPEDWTRRVNRAQSDKEVEALRRSVRRGTPYGAERWQARTAGKLGLGHTLRPRGRPRKRASG